MKIGILTFHWATNYGAVLQCYALQSCLLQMGHEVSVINYKPQQFDNGIVSFFKFRKFLHLDAFIRDLKKESAIAQFRESNINLTTRCIDRHQVAEIAKEYDAIIAGSDQILNPYFLLHGEGGKTPTYFLGFPFEGRKIAYAVSFGCTEYPKEASIYARELISNFSHLSVRENSGEKIVCDLGVNAATVVPDPTVLMPKEFYKQLAAQRKVISQNYTYLFFIRNTKERISALREVMNGSIRWNDNDGNYGVETWLQNINSARGVVTDSFHAMMMALKFEKPFVVVTEQSGNTEMNDRFYSILGKLNLLDRIVDKMHIEDVSSLLAKSIDWDFVNEQLEQYKSVGLDFIANSLRD